MLRILNFIISFVFTREIVTYETPLFEQVIWVVVLA
jgi:hypothetical protein